MSQFGRAPTVEDFTEDTLKTFADNLRMRPLAHSLPCATCEVFILPVRRCGDSMRLFQALDEGGHDQSMPAGQQQSLWILWPERRLGMGIDEKPHGAIEVVCNCGMAWGYGRATGGQVVH